VHYIGALMHYFGACPIVVHECTIVVHGNIRSKPESLKNLWGRGDRFEHDTLEVATQVCKRVILAL